MSTDQLFNAVHVGAGRPVRRLQPFEPAKTCDPNLLRTRSLSTATTNDKRRPCLCATFCILVCWSFAQEVSAQSVSPYEQAVQRAMATMYAINYDKAAQQFKEAIKVEPENPRAYLYLSTCHWMKILYLQNRLLSTVFSMPPDAYTGPPSESFPPQLRADFEDAVRSAKEKSQALIKA